jgi:hypothetical protein
MEGNGKEEKHVAIATGLFPIPVDPEGTVRPDVPSPTFEDFWKVYWNLDGKKDAKKAWDQVVKKRGAQWLIDQAITYRQRFEETDKWKFKGNMLPGSWLRGERWNDQGGISTSNGNTPYRKDDWHG